MTIEEIEVHKFNCQAGDVLIFRLARIEPEEVKRRVSAYINYKLDEAGLARPAILVLGPGESVEILRPEASAA